MATQRLLKAKPGKLAVTLTDSDGDPAAAAGAVTVGVVSVSGAPIVASGTATSAGSSGDVGAYQVPVTATQTAKLDLWVATWTDAGTGATQVSYHEVCGGFFFSITQARNSDDSLNDTAKYPDGMVLEKRQKVEDEAEFICDVAFVPRYRRVVLDGSAGPEMFLPDSRIRVVRSATIVPSLSQAPVITLTPQQLAAVVIDDDFQIQRNDGGIWDEGRRNVVIEYECGYDTPPQEIRDGSMLRLRHVLNRSKSSIPDRATTFVTEGGTSYKLDSPAAFKTGIPDVDAAYGRYSTRQFGDIDVIPVSRSVSLDPSWFSVYHGGRR